MNPRDDMLFLALTRPAMKWGVPAVGCMLNISGSMIVGAWLGVGNGLMILMWWSALIVPIHLLMRYAVSRDHNFFRVWLLWLETKGGSVGSDIWGGATLSPLPVRWPRKAKDLPISV